MDSEVSRKEGEQMHGLMDANKANTGGECSSGNATSSKAIELTVEQKAKIENNRQRALLLREKKRKNLTSNEYVCLSWTVWTVNNVR